MFATSEDRKSLLRSLFQYRKALRDFGFTGFQWIDGSFVEDVEQTRGRSPADIDLISHIFRPEGLWNAELWDAFVGEHMNALVPQGTGLHCFILDLMQPPESVVSQAVYWFGLFSHQRDTALWKGLVQIELDVDDAQAIAMLEAEDAD
jgi:hypothetical protein